MASRMSVSGLAVATVSHDTSAPVVAVMAEATADMAMVSTCLMTLLTTFCRVRSTAAPA